MTNLIKLIALSTILLCSSLFAGTIDPLTPDAKYVAYGVKFHYIYRLCGVDSNKQLFCASGVAIDPNWILTAAHVVHDSKVCTITNGDKSFSIEEIYIHDEFKQAKFGYGDIALAYVPKDLGLNFYPPLYDGKDETGKVCCMSGYGMYGTFLTGQQDSDGKRRAGSNIVDYIDKNLLICSPSKTDGRTELEFLISSGDSGGGLFIDGKLAGINSCVMSPKSGMPISTYGNESGHTRVSKYIGWIKQVMNKKLK